MRLFPVLLLLLSPQFLLAEVTVQGQPDDARAFLLKNESRVTLHGQASTVVDATEIKAYVQVTSDGASYGSAINAHEDQKQNLLSKLETIGIPRGQVKVPKFATISPKYSGNSGQITGYTAQSTLTLLLQEQKQYLELLQLLDKIRDVKLTDLAYSHTLLTDLHKQILATACKAVMARKEVYEQNLNVTLHPVSFVEDEGSERPDRFERSGFGQIPIKAGVNVTFTITPGAPPPPPKAAASPSPAAEP